MRVCVCCEWGVLVERSGVSCQVMAWRARQQLAAAQRQQQAAQAERMRLEDAAREHRWPADAPKELPSVCSVPGGWLSSDGVMPLAWRPHESDALRDYCPGRCIADHLSAI